MPNGGGKGAAIDIDHTIQSPEDVEVLIYSYYRNAEMHGSNLLLRLMRLLKDPVSQVNLTRHLADEARHAWIWTKRIRELGRAPIVVSDGYQVRMGQRAGMTRDPLNLLALTYVAENRAVARYEEHMERPDISEETREVLRAVTGDEFWHIKWVHEKAVELAEEAGDVALAEKAISRYQEIDCAVVAELAEFEEELEKRGAAVAAD
jgi:hypothetical protein